MHTQAINIAMDHKEIGKDLKKAMDDARQTMLEFSGPKGLQKIDEEGDGLLEIAEEDEEYHFGNNNNKKQP